MDISELTIQMGLKAINGREIVPIIVLTDEVLPMQNAKTVLDCLSPFDEDRPIIVLTYTKDGERFYSNEIQCAYKGCGFAYVLRAGNTLAEAMSITMKLMLDTVAVQGCITVPYTLYHDNLTDKLEKLFTAGQSLDCYCSSYTEELVNVAPDRNGETYINFVGNTCYYNLINIRDVFTVMDKLDYPAMFSLNLALWAADRGLQATVFYDTDIAGSSMLTVETNFPELSRIRKQRPYLFDRAGRIDVAYLRNLAHESNKLKHIL